ncbi:sulfurtransferase [Loktanella sp. D2R18]|uniref:chromate resistance protein ChrB domain-containing protein n=1 Tax=Rhodobacterales TaxID=204455 RepID=UPI000DE96C34|nr:MULTISPECIES: sulfurtransferase/chromate resistance protein [Rhodobacterales]MDO6590756.1 sulfurtransferase/chromate resistance protein [Yoonia sp. 1_MG-2023]RBW44628.1 sulfurtransferase [Loktanella sp. D2R18]
MAAFNEISPANLMRLIGTPQCPVLIDVCIDADFNDAPYLVPTATRWKHGDIDGITAHLKGKDAVIICQKGQKLSHGVAARLSSLNINAQVLAGGNIAWSAAQLPRIPATKIPGSLWVTRHRPKIDRIACPWLIRRFIDPKATFMFVPPAQVIDVADRFDATPFDVADTFWGHRSDRCIFDTILDECALRSLALDTLATVVRAADTNKHDIAPQAAGLLAISVGLSRMYKRDDAQLDAGMAIYDALYRWARDGQGEDHDS